MVKETSLEQFYTASQAAEVLTRNSGKQISSNYLRTLARYGILTPTKIGTMNLYPKSQVDAYVVADRGEKAAERFRQQAKQRRQNAAKKNMTRGSEMLAS